MGRYAAKKRQEEEAKRKKHEAEIAAKRKKINEDRKAGKTSNIPKKEKDAPVNKEATKKGNERMKKEKAAKEKAAKEAGAVEREENEWGPEGQPKAKPNQEKAKIKKPAEKTKAPDAPAAAKKERPRSTVFTKHYKTGKTLGVMTKRQRDAYEKEAGDRTFESEKKRLGSTGSRQNTQMGSKSWRKKAEAKYATTQAEKRAAKIAKAAAQLKAEKAKKAAEQAAKEKEANKTKTTKTNGKDQKPKTNGKDQKPKTNGKDQKPKTNKEAGDKIKETVTNGKKKKKINRQTGEGLTPRTPPKLNRGDDPNANIASAKIKSGGSRRYRGKKRR